MPDFVNTLLRILQSVPDTSQGIRRKLSYPHPTGAIMRNAHQTTDEMRQRAEWMVPSDDQILELLHDNQHLTPKGIEHYGGPSSGHAHDRCAVLAEYGLIERVVQGLYKLTDEGRAYLNEELDASELEPVDEAE
ncbi:PhiH1 repressor [Halobaculum sp. MBLA0147]|uniref:PhiH1 repressor n=1 Tax=Halobaculum sp. MBLA0147 TaxID=3079934 RepID=UPI00352327BC